MSGSIRVRRVRAAALLTVVIGLLVGCGLPLPGSPPMQGYGVRACGALGGDRARTAYAEALDNPGQIWTVGTTRRRLAVVPILPGYEPCPT